MLTLLHRPAGATIAEMMATTGWMSHSVRGLLSAVVKRKLGLTAISTVEPDRGRVYRIAPPVPPAPPAPAQPLRTSPPDIKAARTVGEAAAMTVTRRTRARRDGAATTGGASVDHAPGSAG